MLNKIKNNLLSKYLIVLLTGYFSISSMNISNNLIQTISDSTEFHSLKGTCTILKKFFKCEGIAEELDDFKSKDTKTAKVSKGIPFLDYLIPSDASWPSLCFLNDSLGKNYRDNIFFSFGFHGKIFVPPPQNIV